MKKKFLYVATILMLIVTLFILTGCGEKNKENNQTATEENKKEVKLIEENKKIVYIVKATGKYVIPKINLAYDNVVELNKEILEYGEKRLAEMTDNGKVIEGGKLEYKYYENDSIVSVVYEYEAPNSANTDKYKVWNVDKYTGEVITNEQILAKKNIPLEDFKAKYQEKLGLYFEELYKEAKESAGENFYNEQYEKTVADSNADVNNPMYLNENNEICMVSKIYSLEKTEYYEHLVNIEK